MTARIYDRPDLDQFKALLPLMVLGSFPSATPSQAYEGRLQILNGVGDCFVRQIDGAKLPEGHRLYVDQATRQVVLAWPAYQPGAAPIDNPGFESGPVGWDSGAGWVIATENPPEGSWAAGFNNTNGESIISNRARYSVYPGQVTNAKCKVRQGASSEGNAGASVLLEYRDLSGDVVHRVEGNRVMSASKNRVYDSNVTGHAPSNAETVNIAGNGIRFRENKILFVDSFEWDHSVAAAGINYETSLCITLLVSDSAGRSVQWSGCIQVGNPASGISAAVRHWWNMDEESSVSALADQTGNAALTLLNKGNAVFRGATIRAGGSASIAFTGNAAASSSYFPGWITQTDDYAVAAWVRLAAGTASDRRTIIGDAPAIDGAGSMPINYRVNVNVAPGGQAEAFWEYGDGIDEAVICSGEIAAAEPVLMIVSRSASSGQVICHINGVRVASPAFANPPQGGGDPTKRLTVGNVQSLDQPFQGYLQDVAVFDRPLTDVEAAWLYNSGAGRSYQEVTSGHETPTERVKITIPAQVEAMAGFPLYVDLSLLPSEVWNGLAHRDGRDIRIKTAAGLDVPFHLVRVDPGARAGSLFIRADLSATLPTELYLVYGDPALGAVAAGAPNGSNAVWADYHRVYLFHILESDATGVGVDALRQARVKLFEKIAEKTGLTEHQGLCWDGSHYYVVDTNAIHKYDASWNLVASNSNPIGDIGNGTNHCGDPDVYDGVLYVPAENYTSVSVFSNQRIARFRTSDLTLIDSVDVSAQGDEVSTVAVDAERNTLWTTRYSDSSQHRINGYNLQTLAYAGSSSGSPGAMRVQGMQRWRGKWFVNGDTADYTFRIPENLGSALRVWTDIPDGATTRAGNYEGLGATDDELLVLRDEGTSTTVHTIRPLSVEAGGGFEAISSPDGAGWMRATGLTNQATFTMGATIIGKAFDVTNQALLSFTAETTANTSRVTLGYRGTTGKLGVWDTPNAWLESISSPAAGTKLRVHTRYIGTTSRSLFVNGVREAHAAPITTAPAGKASLYMGAEDQSIAEPFAGRMGFVYLRASALSDAWIAAECANLASPGSFYTVSPA
ncbi:LamG-like jellyroll fold domain-containing protein [Stenotrophomonas maltophilia group sp. LNF259]